MNLDNVNEMVRELMSSTAYAKSRPATRLETQFNVHDAYYVAYMYPDYVINSYNYSSCYYGNCNNGSEHSEVCDLLSTFDRWCASHPITAKRICQIAFSILRD